LNWMLLLLMTLANQPLVSQVATVPAVEANPAYVVAAFGLMGASILFFTLELFVPSGGIFAVLCGTCTIASVVSMFLFNPILGLLLLIGYVIVAPFAIYWGFKVWEHSSVGRKLILSAELDSSIPNEASPRAQSGSDPEEVPLSTLIGSEGVADSQLRPVGFVKIDGRRMDAIAEGDLIHPGQRIRVVEAYDNQLKVRPIDPAPPSED
jgi:membrane-bound serine protease (ClpP class)